MSMVRILWAALVLLAPLAALAGPGENASAAVDRWSAAFNANDPDAVVRTYTPDAILLGTVSPIISEGSDAFRKYFAPLKDRGNRNVIGERRTIVVDENAVVVTGFYEFTPMRNGKPVPTPARFTMLIVNRNGNWLIAHQHSSPRAASQ